MWSPQRKVPRFKCLSCEHSFFCSSNLYKHYRTFTDYRPQPKPSLNCKDATDLSLDEDLSPLTGKPDFENSLEEGSLVKNSWNSPFRRSQKTNSFKAESCRRSLPSLNKSVTVSVTLNKMLNPLY